MTNSIILTPHPDDETLGCGGTILKLKKNCNQVHWLIVTNIDEKDGFKKEHVKRRQKEIERVVDSYGFDSVVKMDFPTTKLDQIPINDLIKSFSSVLNEMKPDTVFIPNRSDLHTDHQIIFKAFSICQKQFHYPFIKKIMMYETLTETDISPALLENSFNPNIFIDISEHIDKKLKIMSIYESEVMDFPHARSLDVMKALARLRGSRIGVPYAESFMLLLEVL